MPDRTLSTATRTVLFTDLADYTYKVSRTDREGLRRILKAHEQMVIPIVEGFGGYLVKNIGDSFLCLFDSATEALRAALRIVQLSHDKDLPTIRIAVSTGDVEEIDGDVFGESVNLAARILNRTPVDEIWFSLGTRHCMNDAEVAWESVGHFNFKGLPGHRECFRAVPQHVVWLPRFVSEAAEQDRLVRVQSGQTLPRLPADPVVVLEGFEPGSRELDDALAKLPVLQPSSLFLSAYQLSSVDRSVWVEAGRGLIIGTAQSVERQLNQIATADDVEADDDNESTMAFFRRTRTELEVVICGLALPKVPISDVVAAYHYVLAADGSWSTNAVDGLLRINVEPGEVRLHALSPSVVVDGMAMAPGSSIVLDGPVDIGTASGMIRFETTRHHAGLLLADTDIRLAVKRGQTIEIGRDPQSPGLAFPPRPGQSNLRWCTGPRAAQARKLGFTLDRGVAGRKQAIIEVTDNGVRLTPTHQQCPTFVLRHGSLGVATSRVKMSIGDLVVAGTNVIGLYKPN